jgi:aldehyde dehydrogenase (NAD+)
MTIPETSREAICRVIARQRAHFDSGQTRSIEFRRAQLRRLKEVIVRYEKKIGDALWQDLHKSPEESYLTEISIVLGEVDNHLRNLSKWSRPKRVSTPLRLLPSKSEIIYEPLGVALIVAPWNYPFQLLFNPLVGAISAGCCSVLKPSPDAPATALIMQEIIQQHFDDGYITVVQGAKETNTELFAHRFDLIFFTGSPRLGKVVMKAAAEHLTPVVLELGGKSPCIVDAGANIDIAAKRLAWGKFLNAGQTCIAPDYALVHSSIKEELVRRIEFWLKEMYGANIRESRFYGRIVNRQAMERLGPLLKGGDVRIGGEFDIDQRYISPTVLDGVTAGDAVMQEEIFGPVLPIIEFSGIQQAIDFVNGHEKPLALYYFGQPGQGNEVIQHTTSGGVCINDTLMHISNHHLPFGGVGNSGMGKYHGRDSFYAFSHAKAVVSTPAWIDIPFKYAPYRFFTWIKKIL